MHLGTLLRVSLIAEAATLFANTAKRRHCSIGHSSGQAKFSWEFPAGIGNTRIDGRQGQRLAASRKRSALSTLRT
jgi:hypothetical protein